jgi:ADP-dependent NAD(P)H-hydrate dehydratase
MNKGVNGVVKLSGALLRRMPLPAASDDHGKEERGRVLVIGGSRQVPGAPLLSGTAAMRAGAGKLQLATVREAAISLGLAVPEALVVGLATRRDGEIDGARSTGVLKAYVSCANAVLVGPGAQGVAMAPLLRWLPDVVPDDALVVVDGPAIGVIRECARMPRVFGERLILTPHAGEMAGLLDCDRAAVEATPQEAACAAAKRFLATVVLKGPSTWIARQDGACYLFEGGTVGLGTSGSGDTLSGIVTGLAARGASPLVAALWAVWAHGKAGQRLTRRHARIGFLAREVLGEIAGLTGAAA